MRRMRRAARESGVFGMQHSSASWVGSFKSVDVTLALINNGVDLHGAFNHDSSLHANTFYRHNKVVETLVKDGYVDVDARGEDGVTLLMVAARRQTMQRSGLDIASLLVAHGTNVREQTDSGEIAFHYLVKNQIDKKVVALLVAQDPELINLSDNNGATRLLSSMVQTTDTSFASLAYRIDILLSHGADPFIQSHSVESASQVLMATNQGRAYIASRPHYFPKNKFIKCSET
ncbi:hypothetical protein Poli38472_012299 [Pythium oligandrum]|uniref:Uncharacterized protein n=1 Tax=Pythium oligandrum TaxID=41045 RepID=A0A8K1FR29_PYTOL|nr:hypothetical protein Poli38472_012299 [Pythium oligandrum]|eukprot:TMW67183.1 hypothetical protein Poli38472_012299 [Pythium oligandrum]